MTGISKALKEALENYKRELVQTEYEYRLYYEPENGAPLFYSMQDEPGIYIVIDHQTYTEARHDVYVEDGKLKRINHIPWGKLVPSDTGQSTHPNDITIISDAEDSVKWKMKTYGNN